MANCKYCTQPAGFLRKSHKECRDKNAKGKKAIMSLFERFDEMDSLVDIEDVINKTAKDSYIRNNEIKKSLIKGWQNAVEVAFDDGVLSEEEERKLTSIKDHFSLTQEELDVDGSFMKTVKGAVLRDVLNGDLPSRVSFGGDLPFNFQKKEEVVWLFQGVKYYKQKTKAHYVGGSQGVSVRVAKGVYLRTSSFKGRKVETNETTYLDTGLLCITNKHLYFHGYDKSFRIKLDKIVSFQPYGDGIGVQRDTATAKPETFITGDGWFIYNLIINVAKL